MAISTSSVSSCSSWAALMVFQPRWRPSAKTSRIGMWISSNTRWAWVTAVGPGCRRAVAGQQDDVGQGIPPLLEQGEGAVLPAPQKGRYRRVAGVLPGTPDAGYRAAGQAQGEQVEQLQHLAVEAG